MGFPDESRPENLQALTEAVHEFGVYENNRYWMPDTLCRRILGLMSGLQFQAAVDYEPSSRHDKDGF